VATASGKRRVDAFEELQEDETDRVSVRQELISARARQLGHEALCAQLREIIAERGEGIAVGMT
jgi:hypothetical protein